MNGPGVSTKYRAVRRPEKSELFDCAVDGTITPEPIKIPPAAGQFSRLPQGVITGNGYLQSAGGDGSEDYLARRLASTLVLLLFASCLAGAQGLSAATPLKEYIRMSGQTVAVENAQLLQDGGFEMGSLGPWIAYLGQASAAATAAHSGQYGATLGGPSNASNGTLVFQDNGNIAPGQMYQISVWVKCSNASSAGVALWVHDTQGNGSVSTNVTATNTWQQISVAFTGTITRKVRVHLVQLAGNTLTTYWDDVTVTPLPPNGDFESGSLGPWLIAGGNGAVGNVAHTGQFGATLGGTTTQSWIYQDVAGLIPGQMYVVSVWVQSSLVQNNGVLVFLHDTQGNGAVYNAVTATTGWQLVSTAFTATSTGQLRIHLVQNPGTAELTYWDDVMVTPLPPNGDFETGTFSPWAIAGGNASIGTTAHTGAYGATLGGTTTQSWIFQDVAGLVPGQQYQVTAWVYSNSATTNGVAVWLHDTQGNGVSGAAISPTTAWQQITALFTATSTGKLRIHLVQFAGTAETTYWDDVAVVPSTGSGTSNMAMAQSTLASASPISGSHVRRAAGSSANPVTPAANLRPYPSGTAKANGSSLTPSVPASQLPPNKMSGTRP